MRTDVPTRMSGPDSRGAARDSLERIRASFESFQPGLDAHLNHYGLATRAGGIKTTPRGLRCSCHIGHHPHMIRTMLVLLMVTTACVATACARATAVPTVPPTPVPAPLDPNPSPGGTDHWLGSPDAPTTLEEYSDLQ